LTRQRKADTKEEVAILSGDPTMSKRLLTLLLVTTQFASWGAAPLYLCVGREGSVGIDLGSASCGCRHEMGVCASLCHAAGEGSPAHAHEDDAEACSADDGQPGFSDPCGCTHFLIVQQQGPVVYRGPVGTGDSSPTDRWIGVDCGGTAIDRLTGIDPARQRPGPLPMLPAGLKMHAPVILRC
jgi:hypothetical protein